jgi:ankyrin repeat protein
MVIKDWFSAALALLMITTVPADAAGSPPPVRPQTPAAPQMSPVMRALFANTGQGFMNPRENQALAALLRSQPQLDFFEACAVGNAEQVGAMLRADPKLAEGWHSLGWTGLHFAAFGGNLPAIELLLGQGSALNARARNRFGNTPLQAALLTGQYEAAKVLIEGGADVNLRQTGGFVALHEAALTGRKDLVDLLLDHGAEIAARANDGRNAVSEAERGKHVELAAYLRTKGGVGPAITADLSAAPKE